MEQQTEAKHGEKPTTNNQTSSNYYWGKIIGTIFIIVTSVAVPIAGIVYVCRTHLGEKQTEIGLPVIIGYLAFVAVVAQIIVSKMQWQIARSQWQVMLKQGSTMEKQLELTDRPWMVPIVEVNKPLTFDEQGASLGFRLGAKNIGRSVAVNATINAQVVVPTLANNRMWESVREKHQQLCQNVSAGIMSSMVFPEQSIVLNQNFIVSPSEMDECRIDGAATDFVYLYIVGCVDYQFSGLPTRHQTRFVLEIYRTDTDRPEMELLVTRGQFVPLERLVLRKPFVFNGDYAD